MAKKPTKVAHTPVRVSESNLIDDITNIKPTVYTSDLFVSYAYMDGYLAKKDNLQRVVHNNYQNLSAAWLAGYDGKEFEGMTPERVEMSIIKF